MKYFSMFTGIGGFEIAVNSIDPTAELVGYSEINKYANDVLSKHFEGVKNYGDATTINAGDLPDFDLLVGGFPCQAFSHAGKRRGFEETRGTLFFDVARIIADKRPRYLVLENVKGLLTHDGGKTFKTILGVLTDMGYIVEWQLLNSKYFGVPQNRERVYIVGRLGDGSRPKVFPFAGTGATASEPSSTIRSDTQTITASYYKGGKGSHILVDASYPSRAPRIYAKTAPTVRDYGSGGNKMPIVAVPEATKQGYAIATVGDSVNLRHIESKTRRGRVGKGIANTVDTGEPQYTLDQDRLRRMTPRECERLQAFPDDWTKFGMGGGVISDSQRYKMAGNAITTNVAKAVIERLIV